MMELSLKFPEYEWQKNKGYPTQAHLRQLGNTGFQSGIEKLGSMEKFYKPPKLIKN